MVHGGRRKGDRLEWMYAAGGQGTGGVVDDEREAFLLGKRRVDKLVAKEAATEESSFAKTQVAFYGVTANSARDLQNKVREDPLLAIKYVASVRVSVVHKSHTCRKREQMSLQSVLANPIQLKKLKASHGQDDADKKKKKKKDKKSSKKSKKSKSRERSPSSDRGSSGSESDRERHQGKARSRDNSRDGSYKKVDSRDTGRRRDNSRDRARDDSRDRGRGDSLDIKTGEDPRDVPRRDVPTRDRGTDDYRARRRDDSRDEKRDSFRVEERGDRDRHRDSRRSRSPPLRKQRRSPSRSVSPPPRKYRRSPSRSVSPRGERDSQAPRTFSRRDDHRDTRERRDRHPRSPRNGNDAPDPYGRDRGRTIPTTKDLPNDQQSESDAEKARKQKLAEMQQAAIDLDRTRQSRLQALEADAVLESERESAARRALESSSSKGQQESAYLLSLRRDLVTQASRGGVADMIGRNKFYCQKESSELE